MRNTRKGFHEVWFLKLNDRSGNHALWLRFTLLMTKNGFQKVAETWAIYFHREQNRDVTKWAAKQTRPMSSFQTPSPGIVQIEDCILSPELTRGSIQSKGRSIQWDLKLTNLHDRPVNLVPKGLKRLRIVKNEIQAISESLVATGKVTIDGNSFEFDNAPGMQGHVSGPKYGQSWVWGHANSFVDEKGEAAQFIFDGITARRMSSFYFFYHGKHFHFNTVWDALHLKSKSTITDWKFQADRGELSFRGEAKADFKDFAGVTYEDTDGSLLYCANSKLSDMTVHVYRRGKLESTFLANGTAAFEIVSRRKSPYVKMLI